MSPVDPYGGEVDVASHLVGTLMPSYVLCLYFILRLPLF